MTPLEVVATAHATIAAAFTWVCAIAVSAHRPQDAKPTHWPRVVLLRPSESGVVSEAVYSGELVMVLCVPKLVEAPAGMRVAVSGIGDLERVNRKAAHLRAGLALVRDEIDDETVVVHADADVMLAPGDLDALVAALGDARSLSFSPPSPHRALAQAIVSLSPQAFATIAALSRITKTPPAIAGKLVAIGLPLLQELGGYECMMHSIGDDIALVERARAHGARIVMSSRAVVTKSESKPFDQFTRWFQVIAAHRPGLLIAYPFLMAPLPIAILMCALASTRASLLALGALFLGRFALSFALARGPYRGRVRWTSAALTPLGDALVLASVVRAVTRRAIPWAGRTYRVGRGGRILDVH